MERLADAYDPCPCGSGKKFRFFCMKGFGSGKFPIGTIVHYGPDDKTCTKIVAGVVTSDDATPILEKFFGDNVFGDPAVSEKIRMFFARFKVSKIAAFGANIGCPHEEGIDFPEDQDCPQCPWWEGKQGTVRDRRENAARLADEARRMGEAEARKR